MIYNFNFFPYLQEGKAGRGVSGSSPEREPLLPELEMQRCPYIHEMKERLLGEQQQQQQQSQPQVTFNMDGTDGRTSRRSNRSRNNSDRSQDRDKSPSTPLLHAHIYNQPQPQAVSTIVRVSTLLYSSYLSAIFVINHLEHLEEVYLWRWCPQNAPISTFSRSGRTFENVP